MKVLAETGLTFDDVLLRPRKSTIPSRRDQSIDLSTQLVPGIELQYPIISANMDTVTHREMAMTMMELGGLGIVHRFMEREQQHIVLRYAGAKPTVVCIGLGKQGQWRLDETMDLAPAAVLIDVAHGHCKGVIEQIKWSKKQYPALPVIAGNVATSEGAADLIEAGVNCIKVGVGPGSLCTTRIQTGCGVPQLSAIMDVAECCDYAQKGTTIIADGGIRSSGDIAKALAAGAQAVMIGGLFAGTDEAPGDIRADANGTMYKTYRGMASRDAQEDWKGTAYSVEGESKKVPYRGPIKKIFDNLIARLCSSMTYLNARSIREFQENAIFQRQTYAGYRESTPHGL